jgi:hypothetical protein
MKCGISEPVNSILTSGLELMNARICLADSKFPRGLEKTGESYWKLMAEMPH